MLGAANRTQGQGLLGVDWWWYSRMVGLWHDDCTWLYEPVSVLYNMLKCTNLSGRQVLIGCRTLANNWLLVKHTCSWKHRRKMKYVDRSHTLCFERAWSIIKMGIDAGGAPKMAGNMAHGKSIQKWEGSSKAQQDHKHRMWSEAKSSRCISQFHKVNSQKQHSTTIFRMEFGLTTGFLSCNTVW